MQFLFLFLITAVYKILSFIRQDEILPVLRLHESNCQIECTSETMIEFELDRELEAEFENGEVREARFIRSVTFHLPEYWDDMDTDRKWDWLEENLVRFHNGLLEPDDCLEDGCERIVEFDNPTRADELYDEICQVILRETGDL